MDIFPIAPSPQPAPSPQVTSSTAGNKASDFENVLNQTASSRQSDRETRRESKENNKIAGNRSQDSHSDSKAASSKEKQASEKTANTVDSKQVSTADDSGEATAAANSVAKEPAAESGNAQESIPALQEETSAPPDGQSPVFSLLSARYSATIVTATLNASLEIPQSNPNNINTNQLTELASSIQELTLPLADGDEINDFLTNQNQQSLLRTPGTVTVFESQYLSVTVKGNSQAQIPAGSNDLSQNSIILNQLQNLVSQNNDKLSMTASFNGPGSHELPGYMRSPLVSQTATGALEITTIATGNSLQATSALNTEPSMRAQMEIQAPLRQDAQGQYFSAKINASLEQHAENQDKTGSDKQNGTSPQQSLTTVQTNSMQITAEQNGPPHGFSAQLQDVSLQQASEAAKTSTQATSAHLANVPEDDIINQVIQRFTSQSRLQTSRLSLKLHPAELGELKIDVFVKHDSLKANIFAQTQQAQEILEKHLPRLRAMLEEHGMTVDDLIVTLESDSVDDFSRQHDQLFQEQLADFKQSGSSTPQNTAVDQSFEESILSLGPEQPGVNLTA